MNPTIERLESEVRAYCRSFPTVFDRAEGSMLYDQSGRPYLDFFAGAGALNYGHNHPILRERLIDYVSRGGISHGLDMTTEAKCDFLEIFEKRVLARRNASYKVMFPGPTGTNAVEAALKLARKVTGRTGIIAFTNAFHGMTLGSLAATGNSSKRNGAGMDLHGVTHMPFDGYLGEGVDTIEYLARFLDDPSSGVDAPAAFLLETVQAEGGINVASAAWLRRLERLARKHRVLLIIDDIQVGCGRTGPFFSFEGFGVQPDLICLSKSLSGYGLPLSLALIRSDLDRFLPGEHNGTFRGNNLAFVTATAALETFWSDDTLATEIDRKAAFVAQQLDTLGARFGAERRGRGLIQGLRFEEPELAKLTVGEAFQRGLLIETSGPSDEVLKLLPPLTIKRDELERGLELIEESVAAACRKAGRKVRDEDRRKGLSSGPEA